MGSLIRTTMLGERSVLDPGDLDRILEETSGSITVGKRGLYETGVFLGALYLGKAERRPMGRIPRKTIVPVNYPYTVASWPEVLCCIRDRMPERLFADRFVRACHKRDFNILWARKWR